LRENYLRGGITYIGNCGVRGFVVSLWTGHSNYLKMVNKLDVILKFFIQFALIADTLICANRPKLKSKLTGTHEKQVFVSSNLS